MLFLGMASRYEIYKPKNILEELQAMMNSKITVVDCLCHTDPYRDFAVFAVKVQVYSSGFYTQPRSSIAITMTWQLSTIKIWETLLHRGQAFKASKGSPINSCWSHFYRHTTMRTDCSHTLRQWVTYRPIKKRALRPVLFRYRRLCDFQNSVHQMNHRDSGFVAYVHFHQSHHLDQDSMHDMH